MENYLTSTLLQSFNNGVHNFSREQSTMVHTEKFIPETKIKEYTCPECPQRFRSKYNLNNHMRIHTNDMFTCRICGEQISNKGNLMKHEQLHGTMKFPCLKCGKEFKTKDYLNIHEKRIHDQIKQKCNHCNEIFKNRISLQKHLNQLKPAVINFKCKFCGQTFKRGRAFDNHLVKKHPQLGTADEQRPSVENEYGANNDNIGKNQTTEHKLKCKYCDNLFDESKLLEHYTMKHSAMHKYFS